MKIKAEVSSHIYKKLELKKTEEGFKGRSWSEYLTWLSRDTKLSSDVARTTSQQMLEMWCQNFANNLHEIIIGDSINKLVPNDPENVPKGPSVVVGAGPSVYKHLDLLAENKDKVMVCSTDRMLVPLLKKGIVPYITVSVDGSSLISKWYDDPIVKEHGDKINVCLNNSIHPSTLKACQDANVNVHWFNPIMDENDLIFDTWTRMERYLTKNDKHPNGVPSVSCGGNAGSTTYVLTQTLLRRSPIALIGMDLGYPEGTPLESTPYYSVYMLQGDVGILNVVYQKVYHPVFKTTSIIDQVFESYRQTLRGIIEKKSPFWCKTFNCTEGGTLWGPKITCMPFKEWLSMLNG
jgi:hypothetical protein